MTDEVLDEQESVNPDAGDDTTQTSQDSVDTQENVEEVKERLKNAQSAFHDQKRRAEKAEKELKALKETPPSSPEQKVGELSARDILALRDVEEDDVDFLLEEAKIRGKSVFEVKKDPYMKIVLNARQEERKSANAANTAKSGRGSSSLSDEQIYELGMAGKEIDPVKFAQARINLLKAKKIQ